MIRAFIPPLRAGLNMLAEQRHTALILALLLGMVQFPGPALANNWSQEKCRLYTQDWSDVVATNGLEDVGKPFLDNHATFIASGCTLRANVCPRSQHELEIANLLSLMTVSQGITGSFLPFSCAAED